MMTNRQKPGARRFLQLMFVVIIAVTAIMLGFNYFADRYYVFHSHEGVFEEILEPNTRVLKAAYLAENCAEIDAVVVGSSRAAAYHTTDFNRVFGVKFYNFGVATGSLPGILDRLEWLANLECMPGRIFLPLSIDRLRFPSRPNDLLRKEYPDIVGTRAYRREFVLSYLGTDALFSNARKLLEKLIENPASRFRYDMSSGDVDYLWDRELQFPACPDVAVRTDPVIIGEFASYLGKIHALAVAHGAELILLWNPIPLGEQLAHVEDARQLFSQIEEVSDVIFRLPLADPGLIDGSQYHDRGHFKPQLAAKVFASAKNRVTLDQMLGELESAAAECK